jgi:hypothetical protein
MPQTATVLVAFERLQLARIFPLGYVPEKPRASSAAASAQAGAELNTEGTAETIAFWGDSRAYLWDTRDLARDRAIENLIGINDLHPLGVLRARKKDIVDGLQANLIASAMIC